MVDAYFFLVFNRRDVGFKKSKDEEKFELKTSNVWNFNLYLVDECFTSRMKK